MSDRPLIVDWKGLRKLGWPLSRAHTWRMMYDPNYGENRFPACRKLGAHRSSRVVWRVNEVLAYFETHGLKVTGDWYAS
jgi:predicted DNA-binding transcriptional regulator AlpA